MKKIMIALMSMIMTLMTIGITPVHAETIDTSEDTGLYFMFNTGPHAGVSTTFSHKTYQGRDAYCVEPDVYLIDPNGYTKTSWEDWHAVSEEVKETILLASVFSHGYAGRDNLIYYAAGQEIIWDAMGAPITWVAYDADIQTAADQIRLDMEKYRKSPSFTLYDTEGGSRVEDYMSLKSNHLYRLNDEAKAADGLLIHSVKNLTVTDENGTPLQPVKSANTMYVKTGEAGTAGEITFVSIYSDRFHDIPLILDGNGTQDCIATGDLAPHTYTVSLAAKKKTISFEKTDENGKPMAGAALVLKDENGIVVDSWISDGKVHTVEVTSEHTYTVEETDAPDGYYRKNFTIGNEETVRLVNDRKIAYEVLKTDEHDKAVKGAVLALYDVTQGERKLVKMDENPWKTTEKPKDISAYLHAGHTYVVEEKDAADGYYLAEEVQFTVDESAPEKNTVKVVKVVDHTIQYQFLKVDENGEPVEGAELSILDAETEKEVYHFTSGKQPVTVRDLKRGHTYILRETKTPDGRYTMQEMTFTVSDTYQGKDVVIQAVDESIVYHALKKDEEGNNVIGAKMEVRKADDNTLLQSFTTDGKPQVLNGLRAGETYVLLETETPQGYYTAAAKKFTVENNGTAKPVEVIAVDHRIRLKIRKTDSDGHPLADVTLKVFEKETGREIGTWKTKPDTDIEIGDLLEAGHTYTLHEEEAVDGYYLSEDIDFTVPKNHPGKPITITMKDAPIHLFVEKVDEKGNAVKGAHLVLLDEEKNVVKQWISDGTAMDVSKDVHAGRTYILHEELAADGYYYCEDQKIVIPEMKEDGEIIVVTMKDNGIHYAFAKVDEEGNPVAGVHLQVIDQEDQSVAAEWDTDEEMHVLDHVLKADHTYILRETEWVNGVQQAEEITFRVLHEGTHEVTIMKMVDAVNEISFLKTDDHGNPLAGAKLEIQDQEGNVICTLTSTEEETGVFVSDDGKEIAGLLKGGNTYILHEVQAPFGYEQAEDVIFTMDGTKQKPQIVSMLDARAKVYIRIEKIDAKQKTKKLAGAVFALYTNDGKPAKNEQGEDIVLETDQNGTAETSLLYDPIGWYVCEIKAPAGYQLNSEPIAVKIDEENGFTTEHPVVIVVENNEDVPTGVMDHRMIALFGCILSAVGILVLKRKKNG